MSLELLARASLETIYMVLASGLGAALIGLPLGIALFIFRRRNKGSRSFFYHGLAFIINGVRSLPFIILMVAIIHFTRLLVGTSIGTTAAIVPLTIAAFPFFARLLEGVLMEVPTGLLEAAEAMGARPL